MPHVIRLRSAWTSAIREGRTYHSRSFGKPRTLSTNERVWLICVRVPGAYEVYLNGSIIGESLDIGAFSADVTDALQIRNEVVFAVRSTEPLGEVAIEIRDMH